MCLRGISAFTSCILPHLYPRALLASYDDLYWFLGWMAAFGLLDILLRHLQFPKEDPSGTGTPQAIVPPLSLAPP